MPTIVGYGFNGLSERALHALDAMRLGPFFRLLPPTGKDVH